MNKVRRKALADALAKLDEARALFEEILDEEQNAFDNMPESIQYSERGERMEEIIASLEEAVDSMESISSDLEEVTYA